MMVSPSMPITSVMWVMRREPSRRRAAWMTTSIEAQIISRMVRDGSEKPPIVIIDSQRDKCFARIVGVQRSHRSVMAGVHGLQQVERFRSADFADDDAFRPHTQAVADQFAHGDLAFALDIGRAGFQTHHMRLLQLKFGGVFAGDDAFVVVDVVGQAVQQRGLAGAGAAGDQHVGAAAPDDLQDIRAFRRDRAELDQLVERQLVLLEFADRQCGAVDRQRRNDGVDAGAVGEARVADRRGFVDAPADLADDALADIEQLLVVAEADAGALDPAARLR